MRGYLVNRRSGARAAAGLALAVAMTASGCAGGAGTTPSPSTTSPSPSRTRSPSPTPTPTPRPSLQAQLSSLVKQASPVSLQVVVSGAGSSMVSVGSVATPTAWSTIKVPIAIAALQNGSAKMDDVEQAITISDNDAAIRLWNGLGSGEGAADDVQALLAAHGDPHTVVLPDPKVNADEHFGSTRWQAGDQAQFANWLACTTDRSAVTVRSYMSKIDPSQQFGLASIHPSMVKAGWGGEDSGQYTVRQMGVLPHGGGYTVVTFIAQGPSEASVESTVDVVGKWFSARTSQLPVRRC